MMFLSMGAREGDGAEPPVDTRKARTFVLAWGSGLVGRY